MKAAAAVAEIDLENGGAAVVESWPYPADKRLKEKQPFRWLGAAPYIAVILAGAALFAAGMAVINSGAPLAKTEEWQPYHMTGSVNEERWEWEGNPRRFGPD